MARLAHGLCLRILSRKMLLATSVPNFIRDYLWYFAFVLVVAVVTSICLLIRRIPGWARSVRAASWPIAQGTIESVNVKTVSGQSLAELAYSYVVNGERYSGYFFLQFADEQDAWEAIAPLNGQPIYVRYQSQNPTVSAVRSPDQGFIFAKPRRNFVKRLVIRQMVEVLGWDLQGWRSLGAWNWPIANGQVEHAEISERGDTKNRSLSLSFTVEVSYSYCIAGEYYSGHLERSFFRESSATKFVERLKERGVFIRYNQGSPDISVMRDKDQQESRPRPCPMAPRG